MEYPFYSLDNIGRVIRAFEVEERIFLTNENGSLGCIKACPRELAGKVYKSIREKIAGLYGGQPGWKGLLWLFTNLDSIQVIVNEDDIAKTVFLMKSGSKKEIDESNARLKHPNGDYLN